MTEAASFMPFYYQFSWGQLSMCLNSTRQPVAIFLLFSLILIFSFWPCGSASAQTTATWNGGGDGSSYDIANNWDIGVVPANDGADSYAVVIPNANVTFDGPSTVVDTFSLGNGSLLVEASDLEVLGQTTINGILQVEKGGTFVAAAPINNFLANTRTRLFANGGGILQLGGRIYQGTHSNTQTIMESTGQDAFGASSLLDLSSLTTFQVQEPGGGPGVCCDNNQLLTVTATNGGRIDLSNLTSAAMVNSESGDRLRFLYSGGIFGDGEIDFDSLETTSRVEFEVNVPHVPLPSLTTATVTDFDVRANRTVTMDALETHNGGFYNLASNATVNAPNLTQLTSVAVSLNEGSSLNTGGLSNINHSGFFIREGASFAETTATSYQGTHNNSQWIMESTGQDAFGASSLLDLSSLTAFQVQEPGGGPGVCCDNNQRLTVTATNGGRIDLSNLTSAAMVNSESGDRLRFLAQGNTLGIGQLHLDSLESASRVIFDVKGAGKLTVGNLTSTELVQITVSGPVFPAPEPGFMEAKGGLRIGTSSTLALQNGGTLRLAGNLSYVTSTEGNVSMTGGVVEMMGSETRYLEVGGEDLGAGGATSGNFGIGQLVVGESDQSTTLILADSANNGNRTASPTATEALYLFGLGGQNGLTVAADSVVYLYNGTNVYAYDSLLGEQVHLNSLFPAGTSQIAYDQGFLALVDLLPSDYSGNGIVDAADYDAWKQQFGSVGDFAADGNGDGVVNAADYTVWRDNLGTTIGPNAGAASHTAVPEPGTGVLLLIAIGIFQSRVRRRVAHRIASHTLVMKS